MANQTDEERRTEEGNKASKRSEARDRLIGRQGEQVLEADNLDQLIDDEVKLMANEQQGPVNPTNQRKTTEAGQANADTRPQPSGTKR